MINRRNIVAAAVMTACPPLVLAQGKKLRIAFANFNDESSLGVLVLRGLQNAARLRTDLEVLYYDNKQDAARTVENARTIATSRVDAFIEYNTVAAAANQQVGRLMAEAKIPVLSIQSRVPGSPLFAVDNFLAGYEAGRVLAETAKKRWPNVVPAVLLIGLPEAGQLFIERATAARKAIMEVYPTAVIDEHSSKNDPGTARQVMADLLTKTPGRKVIVWTHIDQIGVAALTAGRNAQRERDILISSTGGEPIVLPEIRRQDSSYVGTFSFFPETWGVDMLNLAAKLARNEVVPDLVRPSKQLFVTRENIDEHFPK